MDIPETVKGIGHSAFQSCSGLVSVDINEGGRYIGTDAFQACFVLKNINIPSSIEEISCYGVFQNVPHLVKVDLPLYASWYKMLGLLRNDELICCVALVYNVQKLAVCANNFSAPAWRDDMRDLIRDAIDMCYDGHPPGAVKEYQREYQHGRAADGHQNIHPAVKEYSEIGRYVQCKYLKYELTEISSLLELAVWGCVMKSVLGMNEAERRASRVTCGAADIIIRNVCAFLKCNPQSFSAEYI